MKYNKLCLILLIFNLHNLLSDSLKLTSNFQSTKRNSIKMAVNNNLFANTLRVAGPIVFTSMQLSSVQTARKIIQDKSVNNFSPLPFVSLLTNCVVWTLYGMLKADLTVLIPNFTGILAGLFGVITFHRFCKSSPNGLYLLATIIVLTASNFAYFKNPVPIGLIGCGLAVVLSGSPLATVGTVIKSKSTEALPFLNSFTTWLNALTWLLYGTLIAHDVMIYGPNLMGFILASIQMMLFVIYGFPKSSSTIQKSEELKPFIG